jgi:D-xylose transport system permease protein
MSENKVTINTSSARAYTMIFALAAIWVFFHYATSPNCPAFSELFSFSGLGNHLGFLFSFDWLKSGVFMSFRNLSNLTLQTSVTGIIAVGMLMVIVSGNIDLSVGSILGFCGGIAAYSLTTLEYSFSTSVIFAVLVGILIGLFHGILTAYFNIPAFIVTLGGLLVWRGAVKWLLGGNTVPITANETFYGIAKNNLSTTWGWYLAIAAVIFVLILAFRRAKSVKDYGLGEANYAEHIIKSIIPIGAILAFIFVMNSYLGLPYPVLILLVIALFGAFITNSTRFGRYLYAIGGNADAARLSGINNKRNILKVYMLLGALTGIASIIFTSRVGSAAPDAGTLKELDAIAACVIGGASLVGGRGTVFGALLGALIMASLDNGMGLLNVRDYMQDIIKGSILVLAVGLDMVGRKN